MNVPKLGLSSHPNIQSSHSQGAGVGVHHDNTTIDDFLAHQHPGVVSSTTNNNNSNSTAPTPPTLGQNNNLSLSQHSSSSNMKSTGNNNMFDNSSSGRPGSISPRPSRGVGNRQQQQQQRAPSVTGGQQQQHPSALRRSPSMPSTGGNDYHQTNNNNNHTQHFQSSSYYPSQHQYSFELKRSLQPLEKITKIYPGGGYQLGSGEVSNPTITAIAASSRGTNLAWGDASGRVFFLERENNNNNNNIDEDDHDDVEGSKSSMSRKIAKKFRMPTGLPFSPVHGATCYTSYVDPLSSQDVRPAVTSLAFLPETSPSALLLTANEKTPKLWRLVKVPSLAPPIRSVDMLGSRQVGPLTNPDQLTSVLKEVRKFNVDHEYNIHSLCTIRDGTQFVSADEVTIRLWNVEYEHRGLLVSNENASAGGAGGGGDENNNNNGTVGGDNSEVINLVHSAPHAPHTLLVGLSGGQVRISDLRCNLKIQNSNANLQQHDGGMGSDGGNSLCVSAHPPSRTCDGLYRAVASATIGCDLSLCGNYIAQRDVSCLHLFDIRKAGSPTSLSNSSSSSSSSSSPPCLVNRWILQDHVAKNFGQLYQLGSLFEKVSVRFVGSRIVTGGFGECLISVNALDATGENAEVRRILCETEPESVEVQMGDFGESNLTTSDEDVARLYRQARVRKGDDQEISTRYNFLVNTNEEDDEEEQENSESNVSLTAEQQALRHSSTASHTSNNGGEWKRITKLCVLPSPNWIGISSSNNSSNQSSSSSSKMFGEVLATCGDTVHHVGMDI